MDKLLENFINDPYNPETNFWFAEQYFQEGHKASALTLFLRAAEYSLNQNKDLTYESLIKVMLCLKTLTNRPHSTRGAILNAITCDRDRPEAYYHLSYDHQTKNEWQESYLAAVQGIDKLKNLKQSSVDIDFPGEYALYFQKAVAGWWIGRCDEARSLFRHLLDNYTMRQEFVDACYNNLSMIKGVMYTTLPYNKEDHSRLKYKFKNSDKIEKNYSQTYQDLFVLAALDGKEKGTYVEIGASDPFHNSNTALLEKDFGWTGVSLEINEEEVNKFNTQRSNKCILQDATTVNYEELFVNNGFNEVIDYLQVDVEPAEITYNVLKMIPFDKYKFKVITFEHDYYLHHPVDYRKASREFLTSKGYVMVVSDIAPDSNSTFEDWWVHPDLVDKETINKLTDTSDKIKRADKYIFYGNN